MHTTKESDRQAILNSVLPDGNEELRNFYQSNLLHLMSIPLSKVPSHILRNIAVMLHENLLFLNDWRDYAFKMGISDNLYLAKIQVSARACHEQELYITMKAGLPHKAFGQIIEVLLTSGRYDVLRIIQSDVQRDLIERMSTTTVKEAASVGNQSTEYKPRSLESSSFTDSSSSSSTKRSNISAFTPTLMNRDGKQEHSILQQSSVKKENSKVTVQNCIAPIANEPFNEDSLVEEINLLPSAPLKDKLSVLIQHTESDIDTANALSETLRRSGIVVKTLADMDVVIMLDSTGGTLNRIFQEVDFIVPVVSEYLLQQIQPSVSERYLDSTDAMNNKYLYELIMNEYRINRCVNFRVRPVIVPEMSRRLLINNVILTFSFRLWSEVPKLVRILRETKELIPEYSLINSMKNS